MFKKISVLFFLAVFIFIPVYCLYAGQSGNRAYMAAQMALEGQDWDSAVKFIDKAMKTGLNKEETGMALMFRGYAYMGKNEYDRALEDYTKALNYGLDKKARSVIYMFRAYTYQKKGDKKKQARDIESAIQLDRDNPPAVELRASFHAEQGDFSTALSEYNRMLKAHPERGQSYSGRGFVYLGMGDYVNSEKDFKKAIELNPESWEASLGLAKSFLFKGRYKECFKMADKMLEYRDAPGFSYEYMCEIYYLRVKALKETGKKKEMEKAVDDAKDYLYAQVIRNPKNSVIYGTLSQVFTEAGVNPDEALNLAQKAVDLQHSSDNYYALGRAYLGAKKFPEAEKNLLKSIELNFTAVNSYLCLGKAYAAQGQHDRALETWKTALKFNPNYKPITKAIENLR